MALEPSIARIGGELEPPPEKGIAAYIRRATDAVPALRYFLALSVVALAVVVAAGLLDVRVTVVGTLFVFTAMTVLVVISRAAEAKSQELRLAIRIIVYFSIASMIVLVILFLLTFFVRPDTLRQYFYLNSFYELVGAQPSAAVRRRNATQYIWEFDDALSGAATPAAVAGALERVSAFWRQPEQRALLRAYRSGEPDSTVIFEKSARYVFDDPTLMKDIDTITRYYDAVSRCAIRGECDAREICSYFDQQIDDFQRQYAMYFQTICFLEGRDPVRNVRTLLFRICEGKPPETKKAPECEPTPL